MVDEQRYDAALGTEYAVDKAFECFLRTDFNEHADACVVEFIQPIDELHGRGDLLAEAVDDLVGCSFAGLIKRSRHVADDRQDRLTHLHARQHRFQRLAGGRHDPRMEGVTNR